MPNPESNERSVLPLANDHNVYILGAGFSAEGGLPLVSEFLNRMRDSHPWLVARSRKAEADAVQAVLSFRQKATSASYWTRIDLENIEELFSLASITSDTESGGLLTSIRVAIAATIDYTREANAEKTIQLVFDKGCQSMFQSVPDWFTEKQPYKFEPVIGDIAGVYSVPRYTAFLGQLLGIFSKGTIVGDNTFVTFNYDTLVEDALEAMKIPFSYGFGPDIVNFDNTAIASKEVQSIRVLKLHGSVNMQSAPTMDLASKPTLFGKYQQIPRDGGIGPDLVPPTWNKRVDKHLAKVWSLAVEQLKTATRIIVIGFSMPATDVHFKYLLGAGLKENISLREIVFVNPGAKSLKTRVLDAFRSEHLATQKIKFQNLTFRAFLAQGFGQSIGRPTVNVQIV